MEAAYNRDGLTRPNEEVDQYRDPDVPVVTVLTFSLLEYLERYPDVSKVGAFARCGHMQSSCGYKSGSASIVTWLSLNGTNAGIIGAITVLLAVVPLTKRQIYHSYGVEKKWITNAD